MAKNTARAGQASASYEKPAGGEQGAAAEEAAPTQPKRRGGVPAEIGAKELGEFLDLTERQIQQLVNEGVLPRSGHGTYQFKEAVAAFYAAKIEAEKAHTKSSADRLLRRARPRNPVQNRGFELDFSSALVAQPVGRQFGVSLLCLELCAVKGCDASLNRYVP